MPILLKIETSKNPKKKWNALFRLEGDKFKTVSFGDPKAEDYLKHNDLKRRDAYLTRHQKDLKTNNPLRPGFLSYYITWSDQLIFHILSRGRASNKKEDQQEVFRN